jgi:hypothetical protein
LTERAVSHEEIQKVSQDNDFVFWTEVSVKNNINVTESMRYLVKSILSYESDLEMSMAIEQTGSYLNLGSIDSRETSVEKRRRRCCFY